MKSKRYPNLHKYSSSPFWIFRKYSSVKRQEFVKSTREDKDEAMAYKRGLELFNEWLGTALPSGREILIRDLARAVLAGKERKEKTTYATAANQIRNHIVPAFGHFRPDQVTPLRWDQYDELERRKGKRTKLEPTRRVVKEILKRAQEEGLIRNVPKFRNHDGPVDPPHYIERQDLRKIFHEAWLPGKLWMFIMSKQGPRPRELLRYQWPMLRWSTEKWIGKSGRPRTRIQAEIDIPGPITKNKTPRTIALNSRVARILAWMLRKGAEWNLTQAELDKLTPQQRRARKWIVESVSSLFIFPSPINPGKPMLEYKTAWEGACARSGVKAVPYNLRDTAITDMLNRGEQSPFIGKYVQNSAVMIDRKYAVLIRKSMRKLAG